MRGQLNEIFSVPGPASAVRLLAGASVQVNLSAGSAATWYTTETGGTSSTDPLTTNSSGYATNPATGLRVWFDENDYDAVVSPGASGWSFASFTQRIPILSGASALGGKELASASTYFSSSQFGDATGSYVDITGLDSGVFVVGSRPIVVEFSCLYAYIAYTSGAAIGGQIQLWDVTNSKNRGECLTTSTTTNNALVGFSVPPRWRLPSLASGSYQFRLRWKKTGGTGTAYLVSSASGSPANELTPAHMRVIEG